MSLASRSDGTSRTRPPGNDARGFAREGSMPPEVETHLVNTVLTNGARYYVDHAHPEYSTPECRDALECLRYDRAGELILARSMEAADAAAPRRLRDWSSTRTTPTARATRTAPTRTTSWTGRGPFTRIVTSITPHFVTRQIFCRGRQGRVARRPPTTGVGWIPADPAGRVLRGAGRAGDHPQAPDRQHPGRAPRRPAAVSPAARDRRRRQPGRSGHLLEGRVPPPSCWP